MKRIVTMTTWQWLTCEARHFKLQRN